MGTHTDAELEVREAVAQYLEGKISAARLHNAIAPIAYGDDPPDVASEVALTLAELKHGDYPEAAVRERLHKLPTDYQMTLMYPRGHRSHPVSRHRYTADTQRVAELA